MIVFELSNSEIRKRYRTLERRATELYYVLSKSLNEPGHNEMLGQVDELIKRIVKRKQAIEMDGGSACDLACDEFDIAAITKVLACGPGA